MENNETHEAKLPIRSAGTQITHKGTQVAKTSTELPDRVKISDLKCRELIAKATEMLKFSYTPYSHFKVGAALLTKGGKIYGGCNIENSSYGATNCAERTAFFKAVSEGELEFAAIAIVGGPEGQIKDFCPPCGICRQVMREFCDPESFYIILARSEADYWVYTLEELLPMSFGPENL
ncbi:MAG: cytidine deaminase [Lachnospiraceae bacterium]|nr:cytidine deaminase [Lachnospiraceae bacterium]